MGRSIPKPESTNIIKVNIDCQSCGSKEGKLKLSNIECAYCGNLQINHKGLNLLKIYENITSIRRVKKAKKW